MEKNGLTHEWAKQLEAVIEPRLSLFEQELLQLRRELRETTQRLAESSSSLTEPAPAVPAVDLKSLKNATTLVYQQSSQAAALQVLAEQAAQFAPRTLLLVIKGTSALGWMGHGFDEAVSSALRSISVPLNTSCIVREAVSQQGAVHGSPTDHSETLALVKALGATIPDRVAATPLLVRGKVAGVLYADTGGGGEIGLDALEILSNACGMTLELILQGGRKETPASASAPTQTELPSPEIKVEPAHIEAVIAVAPPPAPTPVPTPAPPPVVVEAPKPTTPEAAALIREHEDALRIARLLVQELVLYNEAALQEGRRQNDIYDRLRADIDRSRDAYERRVSARVAATDDYFYNEMVAVLGQGNPVTLGANCPGPRIKH